MSNNGSKRVNYYEKQYLRTRDFQDEQAYHLTGRRRHNLGHHTWGIVAGLELVEQPQEGNGDAVDVNIQPGMAVDGFGREILLQEPYKLEPFLFEDFANPQYLEVWITYKEELTQRPPPGYELCDVADQFDRVCETFKVVVEPQPPTHDPIIIAGQEATPPPQPPAEALTIPPDESVPYQEFPTAQDNFRWLIPLGNVNWDGQKLVKATAERLVEGRRYVGNITAEVLAPAAELRIRDRFTESLPPPTGEAGETSLDGVAVEVEGSLQVDRLLTAKDDVQIHGGKLDFRARNGNGGGDQFTIQRQEPGGAAGIDLRMKIGEENAGENRLVIGPADREQFIIADDGNTTIDGDITILNEKNLLVDGGQINLQTQGDSSPDWALKVEGETLQFLEPDDNDRIAFEILDTSGDLDNPAIRLQGEVSATLSAEQLIDLTDGGDTTLHSHPNGILNNVRTVLLSANNSTDFEEENLGTTKRVVAFINLRAIDPLADFDAGDGLFADIFRIDGVRPAGEFWSGGTHLGPAGTDSNMMTAVYTGNAQRITFRLRSTQNARVWAVGVVFFEDP